MLKWKLVTKKQSKCWWDGVSDSQVRHHELIIHLTAFLVIDIKTNNWQQLKMMFPASLV